MNRNHIEEEHKKCSCIFAQLVILYLAQGKIKSTRYSYAVSAQRIRASSDAETLKKADTEVSWRSKDEWEHHCMSGGN